MISFGTVRRFEVEAGRHNDREGLGRYLVNAASPLAQGDWSDPPASAIFCELVLQVPGQLLTGC